MSDKWPKLRSAMTGNLRDKIYYICLNLMKEGYETEAYLLLLSTWNFARFRFVMNTFSLDKFEKTMKSLEPLFKKIKTEKFQTILLDKYKKDILTMYGKLSGIKGIEKTGAPKIMHLKNLEVFVMWDGFIRNYYGFRKGTAEDYFLFLKDMQAKFSGSKKLHGRTLARSVDEHNYKIITEPALRKK